MPQILSGLNRYAAETVYSPLGQIQRTTSGSAPSRLWITNRYHPSTGQLTQSTSDRETGGPNRISDVSYKYDVAGNITSVADTRGDGFRQEYGFDSIGNRTKLIDLDLTEKAHDDETTYKYREDTRPHTLTKVERTTRKPGSTVTSLSTHTYDTSGNAKTCSIGGDTRP
ncbi:hypothetical protein ACFY0N_07225 [Streptomyces vinaceus]|uniref:hypothetical protein n=1 Tax=Streptomyces vinaceus TaxID=1960 RepID=UPI00367D2C1E